VLFLDDAWPARTSLQGWSIVGTSGDLAARASDVDGAIVAIGDNATRLRLQEAAEHMNIPLATVIHRTAVVSPFARVGAGSVVCAGAIVNPFAVVGRACIVNTGATVDHDCVLHDGVHVSPGAHLGGGVTVGAGAWVGLGAAVKHGVAIGARAIVGAGAAVIADVEGDVTVVGVPARTAQC
jgi:sugar O-acyltransferase (sialic acid O-acetyltransferase NeuD family)